MKDRKTMGLILTIGGGICWGISGCFAEYLFQDKGINAEWLVSVRMVCAGLLLILLGLLKTKGEMFHVFRNKKDRKVFLSFAIFGMLACQYTYFAAIAHSNAGTATVLQSLAPVLVLMLLCLRQKRVPKGIEAIAIACALMGTFLLSTHGDITTMTLSKAGLFFGLAAAVSVTIYNMLVGDIINKYGVYATVGFAMSLAGLVMSIVVRPWRTVVLWDTGTILAVVGVVVIGTALAFSLYLKGLSIVGPFVGTVLGSVEPVTAIIISLLFLDSNFIWIDLVGFALILGTVLMLSLKEKRGADTYESADGEAL